MKSRWQGERWMGGFQVSRGEPAAGWSEQQRRMTRRRREEAEMAERGREFLYRESLCGWGGGRDRAGQAQATPWPGDAPARGFDRGATDLAGACSLRIVVSVLPSLRSPLRTHARPSSSRQPPSPPVSLLPTRTRAPSPQLSRSRLANRSRSVPRSPHTPRLFSTPHT